VVGSSYGGCWSAPFVDISEAAVDTVFESAVLVALAVPVPFDAVPFVGALWSTIGASVPGVP
jgi:hypothetical protein